LASHRLWQKLLAVEELGMGHITIRTDADEDIQIAQAKLFMGANTLSRAFKQAIAEYESDKRTIESLRDQLMQARRDAAKQQEALSRLKGSLESVLSMIETTSSV
jgi:hemerythrin superfamily protein